MCGRYASTRSAADLAALFEAYDDTDGAAVANYNVAPTDPVPIVRVTSQGDRVICVARWGLQPPWAARPAAARRGAPRGGPAHRAVSAQPGTSARDAVARRPGTPKMINSRAETVASSPAFAGPFARHRCLVPADGWYEWARSKAGRRSQPFFMTRPGGLAFGGIWTASDDHGRRLITFSIITLPAQGALLRVHLRMPLLVPPPRWRDWLDSEQPSELLHPEPDEYADIELRRVSDAVGDVRSKGPDLVRAVDSINISTNRISGEPPTLF